MAVASGILHRCPCVFYDRAGYGRTGYTAPGGFVYVGLPGDTTMLSREGAQALLSEFADKNGIESGLILDENNHCVVTSGDEALFHLAFDENDAVFMFVGLVGPIPADAGASIQAMRFLLEANLYWHETDGATLALEPASDFVVLEKKWAPAVAGDNFAADGAQAMEMAAGSFMDLLGFWQEHYADFLDRDDEDSEDEGPFMVEDGDDGVGLPGTFAPADKGIRPGRPEPTVEDGVVRPAFLRV